MSTPTQAATRTVLYVGASAWYFALGFGFSDASFEFKSFILFMISSITFNWNNGQHPGQFPVPALAL
jgi:hypothetical protein